ncbi:MAG: ABC transporter permease subunit [Candidatus Kapaibacteriota bacterium]
MPFYPFGPIEDITQSGNTQFLAPFEADGAGNTRWFGTDDRGRDVFARMAYGFNVSLSFALALVILEYLIGIPLGMISGFRGGWFDIILQRFIEIWSTLPILFVIIIVVSLFTPSFILLLGLLSITSWIGITWLIRAEFLREKSKDYVAAAVSIGVTTRTILLKHILPNSLVPIITYFPFAIVAGIGALVSLDFLGFGLPPPTPSWGEMVSLGLKYITTNKWWLVAAPLGAMFVTLLLTVFVGESVREAFDPKVFSRLR